MGVQESRQLQIRNGLPTTFPSGRTACPSAAASALPILSKTERSRARSGRLQRYVRRSGRSRSGCRAHAPTTPSWYHTGITGVWSGSRPFAITQCIPGRNRNHAPHPIRLPRTGARHNGLPYHARQNGHSAQRAFVPRLHKGRLHDGAGITGVPKWKPTDHHQKRDSDHLPRTPNGLPSNCTAW